MIVSAADAAVFVGDAALGGDPVFSSIIVPGVDRAVKDYCRRELEWAQRLEYPTPFDRRSRELFVREYPITKIVEVRIDTGLKFGADSVVPPTDFFYDNRSNRIVYINGYWPAFDGSIQLTYEAGFYPPDDPDNLHQPRMPANARMAVLKQVQIEWENGGNIIASESFRDHSRSFVSHVLGQAAPNEIILDPSVRMYLKDLRRYA